MKNSSSVNFISIFYRIHLIFIDYSNPDIAFEYSTIRTNIRLIVAILNIYTCIYLVLKKKKSGRFWKKISEIPVFISNKEENFRLELVWLAGNPGSFCHKKKKKKKRKTVSLHRKYWDSKYKETDIKTTSLNPYQEFGWWKIHHLHLANFLYLQLITTLEFIIIIKKNSLDSCFLYALNSVENLGPRLYNFFHTHLSWTGNFFC